MAVGADSSRNVDPVRRRRQWFSSAGSSCRLAGPVPQTPVRGQALYSCNPQSWGLLIVD